MKYTVDYFIKKFEAIPEEKWSVGTTACAYFHCDLLVKIVNPECQALSDLFEKNLNKEDSYHGYSWDVVRINDTKLTQYKQPTPKQRILAALYDIKKMQQPKYTDITKELAVLPKEETPDAIKTPQSVN